MKKVTACILIGLLAVMLISCSAPEKTFDSLQTVQEDTEEVTESEVPVTEPEDISAEPDDISEEEREETEQEVQAAPIKSLCYPYSKLWLFRYAYSSVAPLEEQVGDNGDSTKPGDYPPYDTYKLVVDYTNQTVWVLSRGEDGEYNVLERAMICSSGGAGIGWTPEGNYAMGDHKVRFGEFKSDNCYGQYWSNIVGRIYFHSLLYSSRSGSSWTKTSYKNLGKAVSHGCVRLYVPDARWIYYNCGPGTQVIVTTDIEKNACLKDALKKGYECATDVLAEQDPDPFTYTKMVEKAHDYTWSQVLEIAKTAYPS